MPPGYLLAGLSLAVAAFSSGTVWAETPACTVLPPQTGSAAQNERPVSPMDLATLRDFGEIFQSRMRTPFAISPDGTRVALQLWQGDPTTNTVCVGLIVVDRSSHRPVHLADSGGVLPTLRENREEFGGYDTGLPQPLTPRWSRDGRTLAYLRRDGSSTEIFLAEADGDHGRRLTRSNADVHDFAWSVDGAGLIYTIYGTQAAAEQAINVEGLRGWRYDGRFHPTSGARPHPAPLQLSYLYVDALTGAERMARPEEAAVLTGNAEGAPKADTPPGAISWSGGAAWLAPSNPAYPQFSPKILKFQAAGREGPECLHETCSGSPRGIWRSPDGRALYVLFTQGRALSKTALYRWKAGESKPTRTYFSDDILMGCEMSGGALLCAHESATTPRKLVSVDPDRGTMRVVFDPNPEFNNLRLSSSTRLYWKNAMGIDTYGDLVLPPDHKDGQRHPLVVVGYQSLGFLRGGSGDEYPIQVLAARGFAVLSLNRPAIPTHASYDRRDVMKDMYGGWSDQRSHASAIMAGVDLVIAKGVVDPARLGLTGLSNGASAAQFVLLATDRFKAAALSGCCDDYSSITLNGPGMGNNLNRNAAGYPPLTAPDPEFWRPMSLSLNAARVQAPLLVQSSDREYLRTLNTFQSFIELNKPIDFYVYSDEYHVKTQPAHKLAVYERNIAWFDFWLRGLKPTDPRLATEATLWEDMRAGKPRRF